MILAPKANSVITIWSLKTFYAHILNSPVPGHYVSGIMWLPTPIYERIPHFWFITGLLLIAAGVLLSFEYALSYFYVGLGFTSSVYGVGIYLIRQHYRRNQQATDATIEAAR